MRVIRKFIDLNCPSAAGHVPVLKIETHIRFRTPLQLPLFRMNIILCILGNKVLMLFTKHPLWKCSMQSIIILQLPAPQAQDNHMSLKTDAYASLANKKFGKQKTKKKSFKLNRNIRRLKNTYCYDLLFKSKMMPLKNLLNRSLTSVVIVGQLTLLGSEMERRFCWPNALSVIFWCMHCVTLT